jgi:hypothetical protein
MVFKTKLELMIQDTPNSLIDSTLNPKVKTTEGKKVKVRSLAHNNSGVKRRVGALGWGFG